MRDQSIALPRRCWLRIFRISVRELFLATTLVAVLFAWHSERVAAAKERLRLETSMKRLIDPSLVFLKLRCSVEVWNRSNDRAEIIPSDYRSSFTLTTLHLDDE